MATTAFDAAAATAVQFGLLGSAWTTWVEDPPTRAGAPPPVNCEAAKPAPPPTPAARTAMATAPASRERPFALGAVVVVSGVPNGLGGG